MKQLSPMTSKKWFYAKWFGGQERAKKEVKVLSRQYINIEGGSPKVIKPSKPHPLKSKKIKLNMNSGTLEKFEDNYSTTSQNNET